MMDRGPWHDRFDRGFGPSDPGFEQAVPQDRLRRMPRMCQRTDTGIRCDFVRPDQSPAPSPSEEPPSPTPSS
jgi:hypothetical protein